MDDPGPKWRPVNTPDHAPLEPCPFCASTNVAHYEHPFSKDFAVVCNLCGAEGPKRADHNEAGRLWNRRVSS
jgi:Lar family restriction alleviation protein